MKTKYYETDFDELIGQTLLFWTVQKDPLHQNHAVLIMQDRLLSYKIAGINHEGSSSQLKFPEKACQEQASGLITAVSAREKTLTDEIAGSTNCETVVKITTARGELRLVFFGYGPSSHGYKTALLRIDSREAPCRNETIYDRWGEMVGKSHRMLV